MFNCLGRQIVFTILHAFHADEKASDDAVGKFTNTKDNVQTQFKITNVKTLNHNFTKLPANIFSEINFRVF